MKRNHTKKTAVLRLLMVSFLLGLMASPAAAMTATTDFSQVALESYARDQDYVLETDKEGKLCFLPLIVTDDRVLPDENILFSGFMDQALGDNLFLEDAMEEAQTLTEGESQALAADETKALEDDETQTLETDETQTLETDETQVLETDETQALAENETQDQNSLPVSEDPMGIVLDIPDPAPVWAPPTEGNLAGKNLSGQDKRLYNTLKPLIKKIASGDRSSASFSISASAITGKTYYTEADLGCTVYNESTKSWGDSSQMGSALLRQVTYNLSRVFSALLADCPCDLYWFDKTVGLMPSLPAQYHMSSSYGGRLSFKGDFTFRFCVSESYRSAYSSTYTYTNSDGISRTYYLDTDSARISTAKTAIANAKKVASQNAKKSDYNKMYSFRQYIHDHVEYDYDALAGKPYGDPWQLIYVFDNDPETNVVCEGYSKAFQYLCDLSQWNSPFFECRSVTGNVGLGSATGRHMWNIVRMSSGSDFNRLGGNYLVDLTNCDEGSVASGNQLFLTGAYSGSYDGEYRYITDAGFACFTYDTSILAYVPNERLMIASESYTYPCPSGHRYQNIPAYLASASSDGYTAETSCLRCGYTPKASRDVYAPQKIKIKAGTTTFVYNGKVRKPAIKVVDRKGNIIKPAHYKITWPTTTGKYRNPGQYKIRITFRKPSGGVRLYKGTLTKTFKIIPKKCSLRTLTPGRGKLTIRWYKQATQTNGYQICLATNKGFTKNVKKVTITNKRKVKKTIKGLKCKKRYYVKIRTYKVSGGTKYYSKWSGRKYKSTK